MRTRALVFLATTALVATACGGGAAPTPSPSPVVAAPTATPTAAPTATPVPTKPPPSIAFPILPGTATNVLEQPFLWRVTVRNFKLDGTKIGTANTEGVGMWHLMIDGKYAGLSVTDAISFPNEAFPELTVGEHELSADLHNNDHSPLAGSPLPKFKIFVPKALKYAAGTGPAGIKITRPAAGATYAVTQSVPLDVYVTVSGIKLDGTKIGTAPAAGVGYWQVFVDGTYAGLSASNVVSVPNGAFPEIKAGEHEIKVSLRNLDGSPIAGATDVTIKVTFGKDVKY